MKIKRITGQQQLYTGQLYIRIYGYQSQVKFNFEVLRVKSKPFKIKNKKQVNRIPSKFRRDELLRWYAENHIFDVAGSYFVRTESNVSNGRETRIIREVSFYEDLAINGLLYPYSSKLHTLFILANSGNNEAQRKLMSIREDLK